MSAKIPRPVRSNVPMPGHPLTLPTAEQEIIAIQEELLFRAHAVGRHIQERVLRVLGKETGSGPRDQGRPEAER
jgi:hypothetical protein